MLGMAGCGRRGDRKGHRWRKSLSSRSPEWGGSSERPQASHGCHASRCLLTPQTLLPWRLTLPPNLKHLQVAGSFPREMKQLASLVPKPRTPGGRSRGGGAGHRLPCCSKWRPPHSSGDLAEQATGPAAGMAGKWDLKGPWGLSARRSMAWRVGLQDGKEERWVGAAAPGCARAGRGPTVEGGHGDTCPVCRAF